MAKQIFALFLLAHVVGDFYLQTEKLAGQKARRVGSLLLHCLLYAAAAFVVVVPFQPGRLWAAAGLVAVSHFIIDCAKYRAVKYHRAAKKHGEARLYLADQFLHLACIAAAALWA
ncbi:MAG: DUF3307 domain-containing protein, partial [Oscillospiraceae bacterium]